MCNLFEIGKEIIETLNKNGYEAYFVGGSVRDYYLNKDVSDIDITTNASAEQIQLIFEKTIDVGKEHGTIIVLIQGIAFEVTTYRTEGEYSDFRRPDYIMFTPYLKEDLKRRDFTMNALAMNTQFEIVDFFNGKNDINNHIIRAVGEANVRFNEDALRMIRAIRFMAQLKFNIEQNTQKAIKEYAHLIQHISIERIIKELEKTFNHIHIKEAKSLLVHSNMIDYIPVFNQVNKTHFINLKSNSLIVELTLHIYNVPQLIEHIHLLKLSKVTVQAIKNNIELLNNSEKYNAIELAYYYHLDRLKDVQFILKYNSAYVNGELVQIEQALKVVHTLPISQRSEIKVDGKILMKHFNRRGGSWLKEYLNVIELAIINQKLSNDKLKILEWISHYENNK